MKMFREMKIIVSFVILMGALQSAAAFSANDTGTFITPNKSIPTFNNTITVSSPGKPCTLELGFGLGLSFGIQCIIICIIVMIYKCKDIKNACALGNLLGIGLRTTVDVCLVIAVVFPYTRNECKLELPLGLVLGSAIPYIIACIIDLFFVCICKGRSKKGNIAKEFFKGLEITSVIIILVDLLYSYLKGQPLELTSETPEADPTEPDDLINIPENKRSSSAVSRKGVQIEMKKKSVKRDKKERPPAFHIGNQNKAEPKSASKQLNNRPRPLPPLETEVEDKQIFRPQPLPPQNSDIKDRNQRGILATFDNTPNLPTETPRPSKLAPLPQKQPMIEKEYASEEPKKKRRMKKKMNNRNPEEEMAKLKNKRTLPGDQCNED